MADDRENIEYAFIGDVSSLRTAVQAAISLLTKYSAAVASSSKKNFAESTANTMAKVASVAAPMVRVVRNITTMVGQLTSRIKTMSSQSSTAFMTMSQRTSAVSQAFRRLSDAADDSSDSARAAQRNHTSLRGVVDSLAESVQKEQRAISGESKKLSDKNKVLKQSRDSHRSLMSAVAAAGATFLSESTKIRKYVGDLAPLNNSTNVLRMGFRSLVGISVGQWLANSAKEAISFVENQNLFNVAMGDSIEKGNAFVAQMQEVYGMDPSNIYRTAGYFYQLTDAIGMTDEVSATVSLSLTKAANDIASLFNMTVEQVTENLASGMQGMSRAVRKYGMDIRATTLQETAFEYGLTAQVETMSEANRMALRYITMMEQVQNAINQTTTATDGSVVAMGDFARTIESPANQLRIFKEQITQLGRAIGNFLVVPIAQGIAYINGFVMALRMVLNFIAELVGVTKLLDTGASSVASDMEDESAAIDGVADSAGEAAKALKDLVAPFDELNILQAQQSTGGGVDVGAIDAEGVLDPALQEALKNMELSLENIRMKANQVRDDLLKFFGFDTEGGQIFGWDPAAFEANLIAKFPQWTKTIQAVFDNWDAIIAGFAHVLSALGGVFASVGQKLLWFFGLFINDDTVSAFVENLAGNLESLATFIETYENEIANLIIVLGALWAGFALYQNLAPYLAPVTTFLSTVAGLLAPFSSILTVVLLVAAAVATLAWASEDFRNSLVGLFDTATQSVQPLADAISNLGRVIAGDLVTTWNQHVVPMLEDMGNGLAPVVNTLTSLFTNLVNIIVSTLNSIATVWSTVVSPVINALVDGVGTLMNVFGALWSNVIGPVLTYIGDGVERLWNQYILPVWEQVAGVIGSAIEAIMGLWNNVLGPLLTWFMETFGGTIVSVMQTIWDAIEVVVQWLFSAIDGMLQQLQGMLDFLTGIFTGDWDRAWRGIANIFIGTANILISSFEFAVNAIISLVNAAVSLVYKAVVDLINAILSAVEGIAEFLGYEIDLTITTPPPKIPLQKWGRFPMLANGGVITSPTLAWVGEGKYDEAVVPLGDSPQVEELIDRIADKLDKPDDPQPVEVRVFIGDREWDTFTYESAQRGEKKAGAKPVKTGG